jgi:hypothetical protein
MSMTMFEADIVNLLSSLLNLPNISRIEVEAYPVVNVLPERLLGETLLLCLAPSLQLLRIHVGLSVIIETVTVTVRVSFKLFYFLDSRTLTMQRHC